MSHDFLTSLHSSVLGVSDHTPPATTNALGEKPGESGGALQATTDDRHRTVGISMSPKLRERAAQRATALGLPFSRYVQWCVEAELDGSSLRDRFTT
jgi:hypothetical protein